MTDIERFAYDLLNEKELEFADHLLELLSDNKWHASAWLKEFLPVYNETRDGNQRNRFPGNIYRPIWYIHKWSSSQNFEDSTRAFLDSVSCHLEGCLVYLLEKSEYGRVFGGTFGNAIVELNKRNILPTELAKRLFRFNKVINIPAKHFGTYQPTDVLSERTFSAQETVYAIMLMRKLSIGLFKLLNSEGVTTADWPELKDEWLEWFPVYDKNSE